MNKKTYNKIEKFMRHYMKDSAHDLLHVYRVLHQALNLAKSYKTVNRDVLIASCLLHDIGRKIQYNDNRLCHAVEGGKIAYDYLIRLGYDEQFCIHVKDCITSHRFRTNNYPKTIEAQILFDSDKLDVTGSLGIARSLMYIGKVGEPLYTIDDNYTVLDGRNKNSPESFLKEYHFKLIKLYDMFYTKEAKNIAQRRKIITKAFFDELLMEVTTGDLNKLLEFE